MELAYVGVCKPYCFKKVAVYVVECLVNLRFGNGKTLKLNVVELSFIFHHGLVAILPDVAQHLAYGVVQL